MKNKSTVKNQQIISSHEVCGAALRKELWNKRCGNQNNVMNLTLKINRKSNKLDDTQQHDNGFT